jgi:hypothetical protein
MIGVLDTNEEEEKLHIEFWRKNQKRPLGRHGFSWTRFVQTNIRREETCLNFKKLFISIMGSVLLVAEHESFR